MKKKTKQKLLNELEKNAKRKKEIIIAELKDEHQKLNELSFLEFHFETEVKVDFPPACI